MISFLKQYKVPFNMIGAAMFLLIGGFNINVKKPASNPAHQRNSFMLTQTKSACDTTQWPESFGFGKIAGPGKIAAINIDVMPDGHGLPQGSGDVPTGKMIYEVKCASCHGKNGKEGPFSRLVGAIGDSGKAKTIGNYWPYATTLFDYIRRAMPYNMPGSLNDSEVYSLSAYLLFQNKIIDSGALINAATLPKVNMPARQFFVNDDRRGGFEVR